MKKVSKQLMSLVLVAALLFLSVPITSIAASAVTKIVLKGGEGINYCDTYGDAFEADYNDIYLEDYGYQVEFSGEDIILTPAENTNFSKVTFGILLTEGKDIEINLSDAKAKVESSTVVDNHVQYTLDLRRCSVSTEVTVQPNLKAAPHTVTMPATSTTQYKLSQYGAKTVEDGADFKFDLTVYSEYANYLPLVRAGDGVISADAGSPTTDASGNMIYSYTIPKVSEDLMVAVSLNAPVLVTLPTGIGYQAISKNGSTEVPYGGTFTFDVTVEPGYGAPTVAANGRTINYTTASGSVYTYEINNVRSTQNVTVSVSKETHTVSIVNQNAEGYTTTAESQTVEYGTSYSFSVNTVEGFQAPTVVVTKGDASALKQAGNNYTINRVTEDFEITITGGTLTSNQVIFNAGEGYRITAVGGEESLSSVSVEYGNPYTFWVKLEEGYTKSDLIITANNINLSKELVPGTTDTFAYTISNIKENQVVSVSNVVKNSYKVTLNQGTAYTLSSVDSTSVRHGDSFEFSLTIAPAYSNSNYTVKSSGSVQPTWNEQTKTYLVPVTEDITISVEGLTENQYTVTYTENCDQYSITTSDSATVGYNGAFAFTVAPKPGYKVIAVNTVVGNVKVPLTTVGNGSYTINNIAANQSIEVITETVSYTVRYIDSKGNGSKTIVYNLDSEMVDPATGAITLPVPTPDMPSYCFKEWQDENNTPIHTLTLGNENQDITLTANWDLDWDNLFTVSIGLDEKGWDERDGKYAIRLMIPWTSENLEELNDAKVVRSGVFYSNQDIQSKHSDALKSYIEEYATASSGHVSTKIGNNPLYLYYTGYTTPVTDLNGQFTQSFNGIKAGQARYAIAWIEVEINGKNYIYLSEQWSDTAPSEDPFA